MLNRTMKSVYRTMHTSYDIKRKKYILLSLIQVLTRNVKFKRGGTGAIIVRPTVGIGCIPTPSGVVDHCDILLSMVALDTDTCKANIGLQNDIVDQKFCSKTIRASEWSKNHSMIVSAREEVHHYYSASYTIELITDPNYHHPIWGNYRLPDIHVCNYIQYQ